MRTPTRATAAALMAAAVAAGVAGTAAQLASAASLGGLTSTTLYALTTTGPTVPASPTGPVHDSFTGSTNTDLADHTPDAGPGWTVPVGEFVLHSGGARPAGKNGATSVTLTAGGGAGSWDLSVQMTSLRPSWSGGLVFASDADAQTCYTVTVTDTGNGDGGTLTVARVSPVGTTTLASWPVSAVGDPGPGTLIVTRTGDGSLTVTWAGTPRTAPLTAAQSDEVAQLPRVGLHGQARSVSFDDFTWSSR